MSTAIGYLRVSTERQAREEATSLADQQRAIEELAARLGTSVSRWYRDEGASGASVAARPSFRELLEYCAAHPQPQRAPGLVLCLNDSRWGRFPDPDEAAALRFQLKRQGWLVRLAEGDDIEDVGFRHMVRAIGGAQATEYRRNIQRNARRGMRGSAEQGYWTRRAPFGFRRMVVHPESARGRVLEPGQHKAPTEKVKLTPHGDEAALVRWAFETYAAGQVSLGELSARLRRRSPRGRWSRPVVRSMLTNPAYCGDVVGGNRRADGETPERYGCRDAHEAIVTRELWNAVQHRLGENQRLGPAVHTTYLLTGLLSCPHCGRHYAGGGGGRSRDAKKVRERRRFYRDTGGIEGVCPGRIGTVMRHLIDDAVVATLAKTIASKAVRRQIARALDDALAAAPGAVAGQEATLRTQRQRAIERRERLIAAIADGTLLQEEAAGQLEQLRVEITEAESRLQALRFRGRRARGAADERDRLLALAEDFPAVARRADGPQLRRLIEPWLAAAEFDKVSRVLTLSIRRLPALQAVGWPGPDEQPQARPLIRRVPLIQAGYSARVHNQDIERRRRHG